MQGERSVARHLRMELHFVIKLEELSTGVEDHQWGFRGLDLVNFLANPLTILCLRFLFKNCLFVYFSLRWVFASCGVQASCGAWALAA